MHVIVLASQKGGTGKTTLSAHLAIQAEKSGFGPVALLDTDPQGSLSAWWNVRKSDLPALAQLQGSLPKTLAGLNQMGIKIAILDTPPAIGSSIIATIAQADLVLIPCQPSPIDMRAIGDTIELTRKAKKPMIFIVNRTKPRTRLSNDAAITLSQFGTVAPSMIDDLQDFRSAMIDGRTATEADPMGKAAARIEHLWRYIADRMEIHRATAA